MCVIVRPSPLRCLYGLPICDHADCLVGRLSWLSVPSCAVVCAAVSVVFCCSNSWCELVLLLDVGLAAGKMYSISILTLRAQVANISEASKAMARNCHLPQQYESYVPHWGAVVQLTSQSKSDSLT